MKSRSRILTFGLPIIILFTGALGMVGMVASKTPPQKMEKTLIGTLVKTQPLQAGDHQVRIHATGTVQSATRVDIVPQVSGRVVKLAGNFKEGGFFAKGELLLEIDDADYRLAIEQGLAQIAKAEYDLASVESQARVARQEWDRVKLDDKHRPNPLVLYEPQLKNARAALASAQADLRQRKLDLQRTRILAPFNGRISAKSADLGMFVTAGQPIATIAGTDAAEIVVPVPLQDLQWIDVPRNHGESASTAEIHLNSGGDHSWQGRIDRSLGEADPQSRMIRLVVAVEDPYGLKRRDANTLDLAEGLFVNVSLVGKTIKDVYSVPASTVRHQETLWLMTEEQTLNIVPVRVLRRERDHVLVSGPLIDSQPLVTTQISGAAQGMPLRLAQEELS